MSIRPALPEDTQLILEFISALAEYEKAGDEVEVTADQIEAAFFGSDPKVFCNFIEVDGTPVGFVVWFLNYSTWTGTHGIYVEDLFVLPEYRGAGHGKALLIHLAKVCVERGYHRLQWWVLDWNEPSIDFYRSLGAHPMDEWTVMRLSGNGLTELANSVP